MSCDPNSAASNLSFSIVHRSHRTRTCRLCQPSHGKLASTVGAPIGSAYEQDRPHEGGFNRQFREGALYPSFQPRNWHLIDMVSAIDSVWISRIGQTNDPSTTTLLYHLDRGCLVAQKYTTDVYTLDFFPLLYGRCRYDQHI